MPGSLDPQTPRTLKVFVEPSIEARIFMAGWLSICAGCGGESPAPCLPLPESVVSERRDPNLELLALRLSDGLTADPDIYRRLVRDVENIRAMEPALSDVRYTPPHSGHGLLIQLDGERATDALACINAQYGGSLSSAGAGGVREVVFRQTYELEKLAKIYATTPGVTLAEPNYFVHFGPTRTLCVSPRESEWHYVLRRPGEGADSLFYFATDPTSDPRLLDKHVAADDSSLAKPAWVDEFWNAENC